MAWIDPRAEEHLRRRFTRPDGQRYLRHDAHRLDPPPAVQRKSYAARVIEEREAEAKRAALHRELKAFYAEHLELRGQLAEVKYELAFQRIFRKYNSDQPRVPKGDPDGGQWTKEGGGDGAKDPTPGVAQSEITDISGARRRRSGASEAECDAQFKQDKIICNLVKSPLCWAQAMERYAACLSGRPLPPLNF